jgi:hypothetical protein
MSKSSREIAHRKVLQQGAALQPASSAFDTRRMQYPIAAEGFDFGRLRHERRTPVSV